MPKLLILFFWRGSTGEFFFFHGLIDFVLFLICWLEGLGVLRVTVSLLSLARSKMAIVRLPRDLLKNYLFSYLLPLRGREPPLPFWGPRQSFGFSLFPLPMSGDLRSLRCEHLRDPHSFLTVTFWLLDTLIQYGRIVSVLPPRLREPSRDTCLPCM